MTGPTVPSTPQAGTDADADVPDAAEHVSGSVGGAVEVGGADIGAEVADGGATDDEGPSDARLLATHSAGDPDAFRTLVERHRDRLWAVALRTLNDPDEAADALQDALISAYRAAGSFRGEAKVTTWLHRIVVNACLDRLRRRAARPTVTLPEDDGPRALAAPRDILDERETAIEIERALADLPDEQRLAVILVDVQGHPVEEAAAILGCPVGTVKSRCSRGRAKLAVALAHLRNPDAPAPVRGGTSPRSADQSLPQGRSDQPDGTDTDVPGGGAPR